MNIRTHTLFEQLSVFYFSRRWQQGIGNYVSEATRSLNIPFISLKFSVTVRSMSNTYF